ncbi:MAG TPA: ATP-dependent metallopeptidase FtsH/Yme1/Tma family protein [Patescibacteria group bacterium]|nr:ATP-dependent metallopeptidase FtsH/Yme1/Tma family protein [Patescibacteria group bacterium]
MPRFLKILLLAAVLVTVFNWLLPDHTQDIAYSEAIAHIQAGEVESVLITDSMITLTPSASYREGKTLHKDLRWEAARAGELKYLEEVLTQQKVKYESKEEGFFARHWLFFALFALFFLGFGPSLIPSRSGARGIFGFTQHKGRRAENVKTTFADVAGYENVKAQLQEVVAFLKNPEHFSSLGAVLPKGVLMHGPPGTGKTLMARATAGEAGVPFIFISGSDFVEMFVGVGAGRVSSLFTEAKKAAPCIIFIDEIDAVGQHRSSGGGGGDSERDQTINKLLAEMDGFEPSTGVVVIAATNRPERLDEALTRRFGRKVFVGLPSVAAREAILRVHAQGKTTNGINYAQIAQLTPGMSGAGLAGIFNEAALIATRESAAYITTDHLIRAIEVVVVGHKDAARRLSQEDRMTVAAHEAGHAIVRSALGGHARVTRISIIPTSLGALGYNLNTPEEEADALLRTSDEILHDVMCLLGGRAAEEVMNGKISTGASDDLRRANRILYEFVTVYGLSKALAHRALHEEETHWSEHTAQQVDEEIVRLLGECYAQAKAIIEHNKSLVGQLAGELLSEEELSGPSLSSLLRQAEAPTPA